MFVLGQLFRARVDLRQHRFRFVGGVGEIKCKVIPNLCCECGNLITERVHAFRLRIPAHLRAVLERLVLFYKLSAPGLCLALLAHVLRRFACFRRSRRFVLCFLGHKVRNNIFISFS